MKIAELRTFVVGNPRPHHGGRYFVFLQLVTDDGIVGVGDVSLGRAAEQLEGGRRRGDGLLHQLRLEANELGLVVDERPGRTEDRACLG